MMARSIWDEPRSQGFSFRSHLVYPKEHELMFYLLKFYNYFQHLPPCHQTAHHHQVSKTSKDVYVYRNGSNYRMQGQFGPPVLQVSKPFEERSGTQ